MSVQERAGAVGGAGIGGEGQGRDGDGLDPSIRRAPPRRSSPGTPGMPDDDNRPCLKSQQRSQSDSRRACRSGTKYAQVASTGQGRTCNVRIEMDRIAAASRCRSAPSRPTHFSESCSALTLGAVYVPCSFPAACGTNRSTSSSDSSRLKSSSVKPLPPTPRLRRELVLLLRPRVFLSPRQEGARQETSRQDLPRGPAKPRLARPSLESKASAYSKLRSLQETH